MKEYRHKREPNLTAIKSYDYIDQYLILGTGRSLLFIIKGDTFFKKDWELVYDSEDMSIKTEVPHVIDPIKDADPVLLAAKKDILGEMYLSDSFENLMGISSPDSIDKESPVNAPEIPTDPNTTTPRLHKMPGRPLSSLPPLSDEISQLIRENIRREDKWGDTHNEGIPK